ncbi:NAD(P)/FAD-dependent oxidoreductase [Metallosphaera tengchongensis]|uniref:NAD(P)/FAD-dependent oxidoreductase n=1 Tax=Metallosphaera tengchongensis TaxID=1532350 RepID=A0A6N0NY22_9CREN|nr:NAD(P)/FAD-dependent oxidoreductase [Metallosphaera tengchongensis]QKR00479.1 NAD(P)/FAD-dependent oxidoreductase [Metallosphaera tengchongensis]
MKLAIVGGGPAGISLGWFLRGTKIDATVYEGLDDVGKKPCAWGLLKGIENQIDIPKESIYSEIKGFRIFLDGKLISEVRERERLGYIVDKPMFLRKLGEKIDLRLNSKVVVKDGVLTVNGKQEQADKVIFATGHYSLGKDVTIPAVQYITDLNYDPEMVDMYFYSDLLGYGWIFPDPKGAKIGVGGYGSVDFIKEKLKTITKGKVLGFHGARVSDFGVLEERLNGSYIGEALGTVYAVTGEGIRPSIMSAKIMANALLEDKDFSKEFKRSKLYWSLQIHAKVIKEAKARNSVKGLERVLLKADPRLVVKFAMGDFGKLDLIKLFGSSII